jgi:lipoprotein-anchoring transpeptidase ErfK/SrfK
MRRRTALFVLAAALLGARRTAEARGFVTEQGREKLSARALAFHRSNPERNHDAVVDDTATVRTQAAIVRAVPAPAAAVPAAAEPIARSQRWIEVRLSTQRLIAWEYDRAVMTTAISSGTPATPTVKGRFKIGSKYARIRMRGPDYDLPNVPYAMFFFRDYAIHGTYWHTSFGRPMSHGCVNLPTPKAEWLYRWAAPGTLVVVR